MSTVHIRPIDPTSEPEIERVALWMRATLVEVEGEAAGTGLYSMDWLRDRVRWHLDSGMTTAAVLLAADDSGNVLGHTIVRREHAGDGETFGLVATMFVDPAERRRGLGDQLLLAGEQWILNQGLQSFSTWTASNNRSLIQLYEKHHYRQVETHAHEITGTVMVRLSKSLASTHER